MAEFLAHHQTSLSNGSTSTGSLLSGALLGATWGAGRPLVGRPLAHRFLSASRLALAVLATAAAAAARCSPMTRNRVSSSMAARPSLRSCAAAARCSQSVTGGRKRSRYGMGQWAPSSSRRCTRDRLRGSYLMRCSVLLLPAIGLSTLSQ